jgi:hypothetical protein
MSELKIIQRGNFLRELFDPFTMEFDDFPRTCPDAFAAVRTAFLNDCDFGFLQLDGVFGTNPDTAPAIIALTRADVDHEKWLGHGRSRVEVAIS